MGRSWSFVLLAAGGLAACDGTVATEVGRGRSDAPSFGVAGGNGVVMSATGGGHYLLQNTFDVQFAFSALQKANGKAMGEFHQKLEVDGSVVDISGTVTCMAVDTPNRRAWIGGVVTANRSTDPAFTTPIHQPGKDVWFRVVDYGEGADAPPDRTSFLGFEGAAGILTSAAYCAARIWPAGDARTWPVTAGNIQVH
jgi:hypothetical protein